MSTGDQGLAQGPEVYPSHWRFDESCVAAPVVTVKQLGISSQPKQPNSHKTQ